MSYSNIELLEKIKIRAKHNVENKKFFRNTDILKAAFGVSEEMAYKILKDMMNMAGTIENSRDALIDQYLKMLSYGYDISVKEQFELIGGDKLNSVKIAAKRKEEDFKGGSLIDLLRVVFNVSDSEMQETVMKFMKTIDSNEFYFKVTSDAFYKFLEDDLDELDKQVRRFNL